ncbi:MAG: hypothetical protein HZA50_13135, partial [Planctomycetes bacterium]|nr:hypothetical protein [Planctomycetota bacterium]
MRSAELARLIFPSVAILGFMAATVQAQTQPANTPAGQTKDQSSSTWRTPKAQGSFSDEDIEKAIQKGVDYLWSLQNPDGSWEGLLGQRHGDYICGPTALACYAMLDSGVQVKDPRMQKALDWLVANQDKDTMNYTVGLRANVWFSANKQTSNKYLKNLQKDVDRMIGTSLMVNGGCRYNTFTLKEGMDAYKEWPKIKDAAGTGNYGDTSNSQYGLLGVWAGLRNGLEIPKEYWPVCINFWIRRQKADGGWTYTYWSGEENAKSYGSMTAAGLASLFVCVDAAMGDQYVKCGLPPEFSPIKKGLDWFDKNFETTLNTPMDFDGRDTYFFTYYMYGVERVGLASGYK